MALPLRAALAFVAFLGCTDDAVVIELDAGFPDRGAALDVEPAEDAGFAEEFAEDATAPIPDAGPADTGPTDRGPPPDVGPPRTLACGPAARVDDPTGDSVVLGNEAGGRFTLVLDAPVASVGVIARGPVDLTLNGEFVRGVRVVHFVGEGAAASTLYAPRETRIERAGTPEAPFVDVNGRRLMTCASDCQAGGVPADRGCNSVAQVAEYFQRRFGNGRRMTHLQTSTFDGLYVFASRGGCCLP